MQYFRINIFFIILFSSCANCENVCEELIFDKEDLSYFLSYTTNDTIIFSSKDLPNDTLIIKDIKYPKEDPVKNTCFIQQKPINMMTVYDSHNSVHFSLSKFESPIEYSLFLNFQDFAFRTDSIEKYLQKNTNSNETIFMFQQTISEITDSNQIAKVFWSKENGILKYEKVNGILYKKNKR